MERLEIDGTFTVAHLEQLAEVCDAIERGQPKIALQLLGKMMPLREWVVTLEYQYETRVEAGNKEAAIEEARREASYLDVDDLEEPDATAEAK